GGSVYLPSCQRPSVETIGCRFWIPTLQRRRFAGRECRRKRRDCAVRAERKTRPATRHGAAQRAAGLPALSRRIRQLHCHVSARRCDRLRGGAPRGPTTANPISGGCPTHMSRIPELLERKRADVKRRKIETVLSPDRIPQDDRRIALDPRSFHLFAEIKRASLSAGSIRPELELTSLARSYQEAGASVLSVLTEEHFFGGSLADLRAVRSSVTIPILQKDFIIDEYQVLEAKAAGADFVLLIVRFLPPDLLARLIALCG